MKNTHSLQFTIQANKYKAHNLFDINKSDKKLFQNVIK
jgi:hypothetical protein